jgi:hypothetical protein
MLTRRAWNGSPSTGTASDDWATADAAHKRTIAKEESVARTMTALFEDRKMSDEED